MSLPPDTERVLLRAVGATARERRPRDDRVDAEERVLLVEPAAPAGGERDAQEERDVPSGGDELERAPDVPLRLVERRVAQDQVEGVGRDHGREEVLLLGGPRALAARDEDEAE